MILSGCVICCARYVPKTGVLWVDRFTEVDRAPSLRDLRLRLWRTGRLPPRRSASRSLNRHHLQNGNTYEEDWATARTCAYQKPDRPGVFRGDGCRRYDRAALIPTSCSGKLYCSSSTLWIHGCEEMTPHGRENPCASIAVSTRDLAPLWDDSRFNSFFVPQTSPTRRPLLANSSALRLSDSKFARSEPPCSGRLPLSRSRRAGRPYLPSARF